MVWTAYLDESGTYNSPIMLMGGYLGNTDQWDAFDTAWKSLLRAEGIKFSHAKNLKNGTKQFKGWPPARRNALSIKQHELAIQHLQLGFTAIIRENDYRMLYKGQANPGKLRRDSMYGVLFRGCLMSGKCACLGQLARQRYDTQFCVGGGW